MKSQKKKKSCNKMNKQIKQILIIKQVFKQTYRQSRKTQKMKVNQN